MWDGNIAKLRYEYLFLLTHWCHIDPEKSWDLTLTDFAILLRDIDQWIVLEKKKLGG